jgi:tetratricopeptide (TPR) repeat protein
MMAAATNDRYEEAVRLFDAGNFRGAHEAALSGLAKDPKDASLLRVAGRAGVELDLREAIEYLQRAVALEADNADAWRELAEALLYDGRAVEATDAFRHAVELNPDDAATLVDLAHAARAAGNVDEAVGYVNQAIERDAGSPAALRALIDVHRSAGRLDQAVDAAEQLSELAPGDVGAALDLAELTLELGRPDDASAAFTRLRQIDDDPEHEVYAYHGLIQAEIQRGEWRRALDLAIEATRVDRYGRTTDVLAYVVTQVFGAADRPAPSREEVDDALQASQAEHRRLHEEGLVF